MKTVLLATIAAVCVAASANAQPVDRVKKIIGDMFEKIDADEDGSVTAEEITQAREVAFANADENGDGVIDRSERRGLRRADPEATPGPRRGPKMDADEDGSISRAEFMDRPMQLISFDANANGFVTMDEAVEGVIADLQNR